MDLDMTLKKMAAERQAQQSILMFRAQLAATISSGLLTMEETIDPKATATAALAITDQILVRCGLARFEEGPPNPPS